jgi:ribonuclease HI
LSVATPNNVVIYTDGACSGNPGPGGWGAVLIHEEKRKELSGGFRLTTNNRMEMTAVIVALESLKRPCRVELYSDSQYLCQGINQGWAERWRRNNWRRNKQGDLALNPDLWTKVLDLCRLHEVTFIWVKGHAANVENERCDRLAVAAIKRPDLPADGVYEKLPRR